MTGEDKEVTGALKLVGVLRSGSVTENDENIPTQTLYNDFINNLKLISVHLNKIVISVKKPLNWDILNKLLPQLNSYLSNMVFILQSTKSSLLKKDWLRVFNDLLDNVEGILGRIIDYSYKDIINHAEIIHQLSSTTLPASELQALKGVLNGQLDILKDTQQEIKELELEQDDLTPKSKKILSISESLPSQFKQFINAIKDTDNLNQIHSQSTELSDIWDDVVYHLDDDQSTEFEEAADTFMRSYNDLFSSLETDLSNLKI